MHTKPLFREAQKGSSQSIISLPCKFLPGLLRPQHYIEMSSVYPSGLLLSVARPIFLNVASPFPAPSECSGLPCLPIPDFLAFLSLTRSSGFQINPYFTCLPKGNICCSYLSHIWLSATPWAVACQAPLSLGFSRQGYTGVGCHGLLQGIFLTQVLNPSLLH